VLRELTINQKGAIAEVAISAHEIDAFAAFCVDLNRCFFIPFSAVGRAVQLSLRISPSRNNQRVGIRSATDFDFVARLSGLIPGP
jgi:hypothetical protein